MSAFKEAFNSMSSSTSAPSNLNIRGQAGSSSGAPSARGITNALRSAGIARAGGSRGGQQAEGMEVDTVGRPARGKHSRGARADPLSQAGRQPGPRGTHARRNSDSGPRSLADRLGSSSGPSGGRGSNEGVELMPPARGRGASHGNKQHKGRLPAGTPPMLRVKDHKEVERAKRDQIGKVTEVFRSDEFKAWLRARNVGEGMMDMSGLPDDVFLKEHNIESIGSRTAASNTGSLLWKLILVNIEDQRGPIRFFSLNNNHLSTLRQLERLPTTLTHITALDLSNNPIANISELSFLQARSEQKGKPNAGRGSMKNLTELKLVGCAFREEMLGRPNGAEIYQHEILRRFPGLKMLDGEYLTRLVFPIDRQPVQVYDDESRKRMAAAPFTFPCDVQGSFEENPAIKDVVMRFCAKYFPLWDTDRPALIPAYAPSATFSISANPIPSYSYAAQILDRSKHTRPRTAPFGPYTSLPGRNFLRHATSITERMQTLKSAAQPDEMIKFWAKIPTASHPLTEADKWVFDSYVLDTWAKPEGGEAATAMLTVQGQFQEFDGPKSYRSFSRTFVLITVSDDSAAAKEGWPCQILSDTLIIHPFLSNTAYDPQTRSVVGDGVQIQPPAPVPAAAAAPAVGTSPQVNTANLPEALHGLSPEQIQAVQQLSSVTGMNAQYSVMCLQGNAFDYERALANFGEIRGNIPAEAFQS